MGAPRYIDCDGTPVKASILYRRAGVSRQLFAARCAVGMDPLRAATTPPRRLRAWLTPEIRALAAAHGVAIATLYDRVCTRGLTPEVAATIPAQTRDEEG